MGDTNRLRYSLVSLERVLYNELVKIYTICLTMECKGTINYRVVFREVDCLLSHGVSAFLKERTFECLDKYYVFICDECGLMATVNTEKNIYYCNVCKNTTKFSKISLPYATKLLWLELYSMCILPKFITE